MMRSSSAPATSTSSPSPASSVIRYRIDGVLRKIRALHARYWPSMSVRLKIVTGMNIAESRAPQDGRISLVMNGRQIDFRVVGAADDLRRELRAARSSTERQPDDARADEPRGRPDRGHQAIIARPEGIVLVTGPTGSGKTSTLYSILSRLNDERVNIMTLEDPVEFPLPMIRQSNLVRAASSSSSPRAFAP